MRAFSRGVILALALFSVFSPRAGAQGPLAITSISPNSGPVGSVVTITGENFGTSQGTSAVSLNGTSATVLVWLDTTITALVPSGATSGALSVTVNNEIANSATFTVTALPTGWTDQDIGSVGLAGSATYANGVFTVKGSGTGIQGTADEMNFVYQPLSGDGTIVARVASVSGGSYSQAGVIVRQTLNANDSNASECYQLGAVNFTWRSSTGGNTASDGNSTVSLPVWVELIRSGSTFSTYLSSDGVNWIQAAGSPETISMTTSVYVGLGVSNDNNSNLATATFDNVSVSSAASPAPEITNLSATTGPVGTQVSISGNNFGATQANSLVTLNAVPIPVVSWSATSISVTIPSGATPGPMVVSVAPSMNDSNPVKFTVTSQPLPTAWLDQDVGKVGVAGSSGYSNGVFTVQGSGEVGGSTDAAHFVYEPLSGDGTIVARIVSLSGGTSPEAGVMIRQTLSANDVSASAYYQLSAVNFTWRSSTGGNAGSDSTSGASLPVWVELIRSGSNSPRTSRQTGSIGYKQRARPKP